MISDTEIDEALEFLRTNSRNAAKAKAERIYVTEYRKTLKARLMKEHPQLSAALQEREAYADDRYVAHLEAIREAVERDEALEWLRAAAEAKIEAWRTQNANARAEGRAYS